MRIPSQYLIYNVSFFSSVLVGDCSLFFYFMFIDQLNRLEIIYSAPVCSNEIITLIEI